MTGYFVTIFENITTRKQSEDELKEKFKELESMNSAMIDRELRMVELKKQIETLQKTTKFCKF